MFCCERYYLDGKEARAKEGPLVENVEALCLRLDHQQRRDVVPVVLHHFHPLVRLDGAHRQHRLRKEVLDLVLARHRLHLRRSMQQRGDAGNLLEDLIGQLLMRQDDQQALEVVGCHLVEDHLNVEVAVQAQRVVPHGPTEDQVEELAVLQQFGGYVEDVLVAIQWHCKGVWRK